MKGDAMKLGLVIVIGVLALTVVVAHGFDAVQHGAYDVFWWLKR